MNIWLAIACAILTILLGFCSYFLYKFARIVIQLEDSVEESLKILDTAYASIGKILEIPVGSDDPFVRNVINEIKKSHDSLLVIANKLTDGWNQTDEKS